MSDFTKDNYRLILNGLVLIVQRAAAVFESAQKWYKQNADTVQAYITTFAGLSVWFSAVQKMAEAQIVFTGDLTLDLAQKICQSNNVSATVEQFYVNAQPFVP